MIRIVRTAYISTTRIAKIARLITVNRLTDFPRRFIRKSTRRDWKPTARRPIKGMNCARMSRFPEAIGAYQKYKRK